MHMRRSAEDIAANRARYEEHQKKGLSFAPKTLPEPSQRPAPALAPQDILHEEILPGGWYYSMRLKKHERLRIALNNGPARAIPEKGETGSASEIALKQHSSVALIAWNSADPVERLNLPDTVKMQWTTGLGKGRVLFSDMGRVMFSIVEDSCGAHDCLMGGSTASSTAKKYASSNSPNLRNTRDNFVILATKLGLSKTDIPAALSLFAPVRVDEEGRFFWNDALLHGDDYIELRAEMDMLIGLSNCPHPLDPNPLYQPAPVTLTRIKAKAPDADDLCQTATAEAIRGFENNHLAEI